MERNLSIESFNGKALADYLKKSDEMVKNKMQELQELEDKKQYKERSYKNG